MDVAITGPSEQVASRERSEHDLVDAMLRFVPAGDRPRLGPGEKARPALAEFNRKALGNAYRGE